jgi:hypothetical protein
MYGNDGRFRLEHWLADGPVLVETPRACPPGGWHHVAAVISRQSGRAEIYVNGAIGNRRSFPSNAPAREFGAVPWRIGVGHPTQEKWRYFAEGAVDDVRIYARALDEAEVRALAEPAGRR